MLVSLSSYCQYPAVKTIGKDTVVIMTLKQGEEINNKFSSLNDSINKLNINSSKLTEELVSAKSMKIKSDSTLKIAVDNLTVSESEVKKLNDLIKEKESYYRKEKRTWTGWMLCSVVITVLVAAIK